MNEFDLYWSELKPAVNTLLTLHSGQYPPISYEKTYSAVYKCVCLGYSAKLYESLMLDVTSNLQNAYLLVNSQQEDTKFAEILCESWKLYHNALSSIVPVFNYMCRLYIEGQLNQNLTVILINEYFKIVMEPNLERILNTLVDAQLQPFRLRPDISETLVTGLHLMKPSLANDNPFLFEKFIPGLSAITGIESLPDLAKEAHVMCMALRENNDVTVTSPNSRKRNWEQCESDVNYSANDVPLTIKIDDDNMMN